MAIRMMVLAVCEIDAKRCTVRGKFSNLVWEIPQPKGSILHASQVKSIHKQQTCTSGVPCTITEICDETTHSAVLVVSVS